MTSRSEAKVAAIVETLNSLTPTGEILRRLLDPFISIRWNRSRYDELLASFDRNSMGRFWELVLVVGMFDPRIRPARSEVRRAGRTVRALRRDLGANAIYYQTQAALLIRELGISRAPHQILRCPRGDCGRYFNNRRRDPRKIYCSTRCKNLVTRAIAGQRSTLRERDEKGRRIKAAERALATLKRQPREPLRWIAKRAKVSLTFLTQHHRRETAN